MFSRIYLARMFVRSFVRSFVRFFLSCEALFHCSRFFGALCSVCLVCGRALRIYVVTVAYCENSNNNNNNNNNNSNETINNSINST